jgi:glycosyltransferase involved in cell wall biosynthesis
MKIRLLRTFYPHWGAYSGIHQFVKHLNQDDYSIALRVVSDSDADFPLRNSMIRRLLRNAVQSGGMAWYKLSDLVAELKAFCRSWGTDVIHFLDGEHTAQFLPLLGKILPPRLRPRLVATYHQPPDLLDSLIVKNVVRHLDQVVVVSPDQVPYFTRFVRPDRVSCILHGIDTVYFRPSPAREQNGKFRCITVGHWLRDYRAVREVAMKLHGHGQIEFHVVSTRAAELEQLPNVIVHRGVDDETLLRLYQESDVLFLPLLQSTANNALLEGIACGLPVVSTLLPSVKAYVPGKEAVLVKGNDADLFAEAILYLRSHSKDREEMALASRRRAEELDWRRIAPQYEALYSKA